MSSRLQLKDYLYHDREGLIRSMSDLALLFRWSDKFLSSRRFRHMTRKPVFIVGCGHSGTTLLLRILGAHPSLHAFLDESNSFLPKKKYPEALLGSERYLHRQRQLATMDLEAFKSGRSWWVEKTPMHVYHIGEILRVRPKARFLLTMRNGLDVSASLRGRNGEFEPAVRRWIEDTQESYKWISHKQVHPVYYESIIEDFETEISKALTFLGETYSDRCRDFHLQYLDRETTLMEEPEESGRINKLYRKWQVQQPLSDRRNRWTDLLTEEEVKLFEELAGSLQSRYYAGLEKEGEFND